MTRIRAGIVGMGRSGSAQLEAIRRLGYAEVAAIALRDEARAKALCASYGIPRYYLDYRDLVADGEVDVVHVCVPNRAHFPIGRDALLAGKRVLAEKPLGVDSRESAELAALAGGRGTAAAVNFVYRHYSLVRHLKGMIETGGLGTVYAVRGAFLQDWLLGEGYYDWRVEAALGGPSRAMADIGSHWCDLARFLTGQEVAWVCADLATLVPSRIKPGDGAEAPGPRVAVDTEDYASVLARLSGGARASFTVSQASAGRKLGLWVEVDGSEASARWSHDSADRLWIGHRDRPNEELVLHPGLLNEAGRSEDRLTGAVERWPDAQKDMIDSFYRSILDGERRRYADFSDGHEAVKVTEAALASAKSGRWERVGEPEEKR